MKAPDFENGLVIREPVGNDSGYWVGAPGAFYAAEEQAWYLTYRIRRPRGVEPDRGGEAKIARSTDLKTWTDIWSVTKDKYSSASIERSAIRLGPDKIWRYFTSYVDPTDGRWCVSVLKSSDPAKFNPAEAQNVFNAAPLGLEGIKDPWIMEYSGLFYMFLSVAVRTDRTNEQSHATLDIYNTGECVSATGLATSRDLDHWHWEGIVFRPEGTGWDCYCRRINSVLIESNKIAAFYDGSASHRENYEEKTGFAAAVTKDLKKWFCMSPKGPMFTSPHASGSLRYIDAQVSGNEAILFYEFAKPNGSHDLRLIKYSGS